MRNPIKNMCSILSKTNEKKIYTYERQDQEKTQNKVIVIISSISVMVIQ